MPFCKLLDGTTVLSIYDKDQDDYCLTNYAAHEAGINYKFYDRVIGKEVECKTGEIFLQSQKIPNAQKRAEFIRQANKWGSDWARTQMRNNQRDWGAQNPSDWFKGGRDEIQLQINKAKREQSAKVDRYLTYCGDNGIHIIEDTAGANYVDNDWGAGAHGTGQNILGNTLTATSKSKKGQNTIAVDLANYQSIIKNWNSNISPSYQRVAPKRHASSKGDSSVLMQNLPGVTTLANPIDQQAPLLKAKEQKQASGSYYYFSNGKNQRLTITNNEIAKAEYTPDEGKTWIQVDPKNPRINSLVEQFKLAHPVSTRTAALNPSAKQSTILPQPAITPSRTPSLSSMKTFISDAGSYGNNSKAQADDIWKHQVQSSLDEGKKVGLIYSANNEQAENLHSANRKNVYAQNLISGGGQAAVFQHLANKIAQEKCADRVHILPIATSMYGGNNSAPGNQVTRIHIDRDLNAIAFHKDSGWEIRGIADLQAKEQYAIGSGISSGWKDVNVAPIQVKGKPTSQGEYVQTCLALMEQGRYQPQRETTHQIPSGSRTKDWASVRTPAITTPVIVNTFSLVAAVGTETLADLKNYLDKGKTLIVEDAKDTLLAQYLQAKDQDMRDQAADLVAVYSVKQVLHNLHANVRVNMVDNNQATSISKKHDRHAMKVTFATQEEARTFSNKLFKEYGIHSYTFGPKFAKTPQNGSVFLTKEDLQKIAQISKIIRSPDAGKHAYEIKASQFEMTKQANIAPADNAEEPASIKPR